MAELDPRPAVAVVIPARDEERHIAACLRSLADQRYDRFETIVVDDGSRDRTREIAAGFDGVRLLEGGGLGPSHARNVGIRSTTAEIVAFTDADCVCDPDWLSQLVAVLRRGAYVGAGGAQACPKDECPFGRRVHRFLELAGFVGGYVKDLRGERPTEHNPTCNSAYLRRVVLEVDGFDEALWPGEDVDLDRRLTTRGHRLAYTPSAVVFHYRPATVYGFARMMRAYGRAQAYLIKKHGPFRPLHAVPALVGLGVLAAPMLALPPTLPFSLAGLALGPWALFRLRGAPSGEAARNIPLLYAALVAWHAGFAFELLAPRTTCRG